MEELKTHDIKFLKLLVKKHEESENPIDNCVVTLNAVLSLFHKERSVFDIEVMKNGLLRIIRIIKSNPEQVLLKLKEQCDHE